MDRKTVYIVRNNQIEHVWQFRIVTNFFNTFLYVRGTESEVVDYINSEFPDWQGSYTAMSESEYAAIDRLGMSVYIAPQK